MKRLLTYLFLVLGLGLVFNFSSHSAIRITNDSILIICTTDYSGNTEIYMRELVDYEKEKNHKFYKDRRTCDLVVSKKKYPALYKNIMRLKRDWQHSKYYFYPDQSMFSSIKNKFKGTFNEIRLEKSSDPNTYYIAKKEPTKTQQVAKKEKKKENIKANQNLINKYFGHNSPKILIIVIVLLGIPIIGIFILKSQSKQKTAPFVKDKKELKSAFGQLTIAVIAGSLFLGIYSYFIYYESDSPTQIQQVEKKEKKKKKVAKVVEQEQEEFKPKKKDLDTDPPRIEIAEAITFNDSDYEFEGKVTDKSKQIYIEVDGRLVDVKRGKFKIKGYSPVDKEISIEAIDGHGNRSKPKIVKIIIDIKDTVVAKKLEPLNPSKIIAKTSENKVALIIGIENYTEAPKANYANLDAKYFFDYARKAFGVKKQNINLLINEDATYVKTNKALTLWLRTKVKTDQTDLIIFFAGHGLASSDGKELYLLPQDSDPNLLDITALSRTKLFQTIVDLKPKSVTMFLDTCYSGVSRDEQMLLASARPIRIVAGDEGGIPNNFTIFSATQLDQISSGFKEAKHGIFSYYLMKGLEGKADANKNKEITNGELLAYMDINVSQKALEQGRQQNPSLSGDPDQVLMKY